MVNGHAWHEEVAITGRFTEAERKRFHGLLRLAADSPFEGERANALAAARRLAARHGLTLEEASVDSTAPRQHRTGFASAPRETVIESIRFVYLMDWQIHVAKARRDAALAEARARGLDAAELNRRRPPEMRPRANSQRRDPWTHAQVLLTETNLRLRDIVDITGLTIYQIAGLKLRLRRAA